MKSTGWRSWLRRDTQIPTLKVAALFVNLLPNQLNYIVYNFSTLLPRMKISHKDNNSQLSINIIRNTSKAYKMLAKEIVKKKLKKYRDKIDYFQFLHFSILYRAFAIHLPAVLQRLLVLILKTKQKKICWIFMIKFLGGKYFLRNLKLLIEQQNSITSINLIYFSSLFWVSFISLGRRSRRSAKDSSSSVVITLANGRRRILAYFHNQKKKVNFHTCTNSFHAMLLPF